MPKTAFSALQGGLGSVPLHHELMAQEMCHPMHASADMRPYMHREDMVSLQRMHPQPLPHSSLRPAGYHPNLMPMHVMHAADHAVHPSMAHMHGHHHPYSAGMQVPSHMYLYDSRPVPVFDGYEDGSENDRSFAKRRAEYYDMSAQPPRKVLQEREPSRAPQHSVRSPTKSTSPRSTAPATVEESDELAASILAQMHSSALTGHTDADLTGLAMECLKTRVQLWNKHADVFRKLDSAKHKELSELIAADRPLLERCNGLLHSMEFKSETVSTRNRTPDRDNASKSASAAAVSPSGDDFNPEPASAYCNGCIVMIRRDNRVATVIREKAGGWRVVLFEDGTTGRFRPSDLQKIKDPEGVEPREGEAEHKHNHSNPFQDCVGLTVVIRKSGRVGTIIGEKAGGWRIVQFDDGSTGTHRPSDMDIVTQGKDNGENESIGDDSVVHAHDEDAGPDTDEASTTSSTSVEHVEDRPSSADDSIVSTERPEAAPATAVEAKPLSMGSTPLSIKAVDVAVPLAGISIVTPLSTSSAPAVEQPAQVPCPTVSIPLNELVIVKRTGKKGLVVSEKAGGWRVIEFEDGTKTTCRPSDLLVCEQFSSKPASTLSVVATAKPAGFQFGVESKGFEKLFSQPPAALDSGLSNAPSVTTKRKLSETFDEPDPSPPMDIRVPGVQGPALSYEPVNIVTPRAVTECPTSPFKKEKLAEPTDEASTGIPLQT
jgi:hypothetical protein